MFAVTPIVFVVRAGPNFKNYGDEYDFSCTVTIVDGVAFVQGASGNMPSPSVVKQFIKKLYSFGASSVCWERSTGKKVVHNN